MAIKFLRDFNSFCLFREILMLELKPQGKTPKNIKKSGILYQDEHRADSYKRVKKIIDEYHKAFIEKSLRDFELSVETLEEHLFSISKSQTKTNRKRKGSKNYK
ncbi:MAG: hypothetical protein LBQ18_05670 [Campylobacteraceae bacterium]|jgi:CRISPR-associated protein Cpf1|nr:hypothetical protein [Campylobacteraceae bacterium]